jgi:hypothetical protein
MLRSFGACRAEIVHFDEIFPKGAVINFRNLKKAITKGCDICWLFEELSPEYKGAMRKVLGMDGYDDCYCPFCRENRRHLTDCRLRKLAAIFVKGFGEKRD